MKACALLAAAGVLLASSAALANGRFPRAQRLAQDAERPEQLALYGTYGLVTSSDAGQSWQYVCEAATGPFSGEAPLLELLPGGRIVLSSETGLRGSSFPACEWSGLLEPPLPNIVEDITPDPANAEALWALLSEPDVSVGYRAALQRSEDGGDSWSASRRIPTEVLARGLTIDASPTQPARLYASGLSVDGQGVLARSDDAGETWRAFSIPGADSSAMPYIAAVAADDSALFVRTDALADHEGSLQPNDALLYSADGGQTFTRIFEHRAKLLGFALSPDGETLLLGYGDPVLFAYTVEPEQVGLYRMRTSELNAEPRAERIFAGSVTCLRWTEHGLFACLAQGEQGFELGRADDAEFSEASVQPFQGLLDLTQLRPLVCPEDSTAATCSGDSLYGWPLVCGKLGADCELEPEPATTETEQEGGCDCRATARGPSRSRLGWLLAGAVVLLRRRAQRGRARLDTNAL